MLALDWFRRTFILDPHFENIRRAINEHRQELIVNVDIELLGLAEEHRVQAQELNERLAMITNDANLAVVRALGAYPDLIKAGRRRVVFEAPRLTELPSVYDERRRRVADIDSRVRRAHALLNQFWKNSAMVKRFSLMSVDDIVAELMRPALPPVSRKAAA